MRAPSWRNSLFALWICAGGPAVWGLWITLRLGLLVPGDFLALLRPTGFLILAAFLVAQFLVQGGERTSASLQCALVAALGSAGTFGFVFIPPLLGAQGSWLGDPAWPARASLAALAGSSLVALFYPSLCSFFLADPRREPRPGPVAARILGSFIRRGRALGLIAYLAVALLSGVLEGLGPAGLAGMLFPLVMGVMLSSRAVALLDRMERGIA